MKRFMVLVTGLEVKNMRKLTDFLSGGMSRSFKIAFTLMFILINLSVITINTLYIQSSIRQQNESLVDMVVHLTVFSDDETVITYLEHYGHTHEVFLFYETADGQYRHETDVEPEGGQSYPVIINGVEHGTIVIDNAQSNLLMANLTYLLILNLVIIGVYIGAIHYFNKGIQKANKMVLNDFKRLHQAVYELDFSTQYRFKDIHQLAESFELSYDNLKTMQTKHKDHVEKLAHDIKTPLTIIQGLIEGVVAGRLTPDQEMKHSLREEIERISQLIDTIIHDTATELIHEFDLSALLDETLEKHKVLFEDKGVELSWQIDRRVTLLGSKEDIRRVIDHLLMNSLKFTDAPSTVDIQLKTSPKQLMVKDQGQGMDKETQSKLFKPMASETGSGVGLKIVKSILDRHHASITVDSAFGEGTTVKIIFDS